MTLTVFVDLVHEDFHFELARVLAALTHGSLQLVDGYGAIAVLVERAERLLDV